MNSLPAARQEGILFFAPRLKHGPHDRKMEYRRTDPAPHANKGRSVLRRLRPFLCTISHH